MYYRKLGSTGHLTGEIGIDARVLAAVPSDDEAIGMLRHAIVRGAGFIEAAGDARGDGLVRRAIDGRREEVLIATRGGQISGDGASPHGFSAERITRAAQESVARLACGQIDLFQLDHPTIDGLRDQRLWEAMERLKSDGVVRHVGIVAAGVDVALAALQDNRIETLQIVLNALDPSMLPVLARAREAGVGVIVRDPLVPGPAGDGPADPQGFEPNGSSRQQGAQPLALRFSILLAESGHTSLHASLGWVLAHAAVSVAIAAPRSRAELEEILAVSGRPLPSTRQMLAIHHLQLNTAAP